MKWYFMAEAEQELKEAKAHYEREKRGLGKQFLLEVRKAIRRILKFPKAGSLLTNDVHRRRTNKFPMHLHREPGYWKDRL
jgi:hypothetical protein